MKEIVHGFFLLTYVLYNHATNKPLDYYYTYYSQLAQYRYNIVENIITKT